MDRELATHREDLPHVFDDTGFGVLCWVCHQERAAALHTPAAREVAATQSTTTLQREVGS